MSHVHKPNWQPDASREMLKSRAKLYQTIRDFFLAREVLEVETPLLSRYCVTDPFLDSFSVNTEMTLRYLQTSPEYAMKRLLASGAGSIYQIAKCFRKDEAGRFHNPEFSMLEWYRVGFDEHQLIDEIDSLLQHTIESKPLDKKSYQQLFLETLEINPLTIDLNTLQQCCHALEISIPDIFLSDKTTILQTLFSIKIEPTLGFERPLVVYDFPKEQAALSRLSLANPAVACRFEVFVSGIELANGFYELTDAKEQERRFIKDNQIRQSQGKEQVALDEAFLAALEFGLPDCSGVALGLDRLLMFMTKAKTIKDVLSFSWEKA